MGSAFFLPVLNLVTATDRFNRCVESEKSVCNSLSFRNQKMRKYLKKKQPEKAMGLFKTCRSVFNGIPVNFRFLINGHRTVRSCVFLVTNA